MTYLPDINFWLALCFSGHTGNVAATAWFDALSTDDRCDFCRYTQMGFLRLSTNPKVNPRQTCTMSQAWQVYDTTRTDSRVGWADEPAGVEAGWRGFTQGGTFSPNVWNDAFLAAFAVAGGYTLVTFDAGFRRYAGLNLVLL